jgi:hypothetical protein
LILIYRSGSAAIVNFLSINRSVRLALGCIERPQSALGYKPSTLRLGGHKLAQLNNYSFGTVNAGGANPTLLSKSCCLLGFLARFLPSEV